MLLTNEEVIEIAGDMLDYSDFGRYFGNEDYIVEFAYAVVKAEFRKRYELDLERNRLCAAEPVMN